jgi:hypothetical protein
MSWSPSWIAVGAATAVAADVAVRRLGPDRRLTAHAIGLVGAAVIYPALHSGAGAEPSERRREVAGVVACAALAAAAARSERRARVLGLAWASHALFDAVHHRSSSSLLPDWYPAACAGYDVTLGALLALPGPTRKAGQTTSA